MNELGDQASSQDTEEAVRQADVVVIAVPFKAWPELARQIAALVGVRPVIDTTNFNRERDGEIADRARKHAGGTLGFISELLPNAKLVKSLNTLPANFLYEESGKHYAVPLAGDDASAIETASTLVRDAGFDPVIVGKADRAKDFDNEKPVWNHPMRGPPPYANSSEFRTALLTSQPAHGLRSVLHKRSFCAIRRICASKIRDFFSPT